MEVCLSKYYETMYILFQLAKYMIVFFEGHKLGNTCIFLTIQIPKLLIDN